jgi:hypothetical protein
VNGHCFRIWTQHDHSAVKQRSVVVEPYDEDSADFRPSFLPSCVGLVVRASI